VCEIGITLSLQKSGLCNMQRPEEEWQRRHVSTLIFPFDIPIISVAVREIDSVVRAASSRLRLFLACFLLSLLTLLQKMRFSLGTIALALGLVASVSAQGSSFESSDFNVTEALYAAGVNVSTLPELASLSTRSSTTGCTIAVSLA
jgi:hypothetical protein